MSELPGYDKPRQQAQQAQPGLPPAAAAAYAAVYASAAKEKTASAEAPQQAYIAASPAMPAPSMQARGKLRSRVRLLPLTIMAVALLLGLKLGGLWQGRGTLFVTPADAQQAQPAQTAQAQTPAQAPAQTSAPAPAQQQQGQAQPAQAAGAQAPAQNSAVASLADRDPTTFTRAEIELLANLAQRREQLEQRARELDLRESLLAAAEKRIDERINELKKLEASIKQVVQTTDKQEDENLRGLVKIYETMKPEEAARIFADLNNAVLLNVMERMKEAKVAAIMAKMDPAKAQDITVQMASRKMLPANLRAGVQGAGQPAAAQPGANQAAPTARPAGQAPAGQAPAQQNRGG